MWETETWHFHEFSISENPYLWIWIYQIISKSKKQSRTCFFQSVILGVWNLGFFKFRKGGCRQIRTVIFWKFWKGRKGRNRKLKVFVVGPKQFVLMIVLKKRKSTWWNLNNIFENLKDFWNIKTYANPSKLNISLKHMWYFWIMPDHFRRILASYGNHFSEA